MAAAEPQWPAVLRTKELRDKIAAAKVLCVGAGGIGCELLKTLVCSGFRNIEVIDLDTIETSNLNRQFLFRKHHVGQSKANTAAGVVKGFCPSASLTAHHANVKEGRFDLDFFRGFDIVLNGLDNLEARRHVNRLCLASERPLVESGTAGYLGQVTVHLKGRTECFECQPKPTPKSFPICTLRNTPDRPIHTVVWAKDLLFNRLFGRPEAVSDLDEQAQREDGQQAQDGAADDASASATAAAAAAVPDDPSFFLRREGPDGPEGALEYAARVFERVYTSDIQRLTEVKELWEKRAPPVPLRMPDLIPESDMEALRTALRTAKEGGLASASKALGLSNASQKWTPAQNASVLLLAIAMYHETRKDEVGSSSFDKDDDLAVDFVTAASNLRSTCYGIPEQSLFDAKGMAGNIIHAIATTNAVISGLIVTEAIKILAGCLSAVRNTFLYEFPSRKRQLVTVNSEPPKKGCMVCGKTQLSLRINTETTTLSSLLSGVIKKRLAVNTPNLLAGGFLYEEGEGLEDDEQAAYAALLPRPLAALPGGGLRHGTILTVQDQSQHFSVDLILTHTDSLDPEEAPEGFLLEGELPAQGQGQEGAGAEADKDGASKAQAVPEEEAPGPARRMVAASVRETDDGVLCLDEEEEEAPKPASRKRALDEGDEGAAAAEEADGGAHGAKRAKTDGAGAGAAAAADEGDDEVMLIDDDD
ncbi:hypothetical protein HYH03_004959 [Edaphochlamys debaryana]|uniref:SUMO-activating enzyme subunit n=1 Tax=Edaphochlamys debaryana TaxID=47281 RepID=A0A835Y6K3_9CHLO|nr:hypothetical protein HYH03_004959 [Edaphochlamys debaryana]|eukprot:KAG2496953.1 hypothetical protein HYH03_004959 [Edaphochlamys debaryana]